MNILIVDDDPHNLKLLGAQLNRAGHHVVHAADGVEALALLQREPADAIISDILMPRMDGYRFCHELRKDGRWCELPFIFYSSTYTAPEDEKLAFELGADRFIRKPSPIDVLLQALNGTDAANRRHEPASSATSETELMKEYSQRLVAKLEEKNRELTERTAELRALAARVEAAREEERLRISREMHDEMGAALTSIKLELKWMKEQLMPESPGDRAQLAAKLEAVCGSLDAAAARVRKLCMELRPSILDDLGLVSAIEWQAQEFERRTRIRCEAALPAEERKIATDAATAMFRIFQEILTNVARHSAASKVRVRLEQNDSGVTLEVKDNGRGITSAERAGGKSLGLLGMKERAAQLAGRVTIEGKHGKGTGVTVFIPTGREHGATTQRVGAQNNSE